MYDDTKSPAFQTLSRSLICMIMDAYGIDVCVYVMTHYQIQDFFGFAQN